MKRKILVSLLVLSLTLSFAGCQTSSQVDESTSSRNIKSEKTTDTNITTDTGTSTDTAAPKDTTTDTTESLLNSEDIKELESVEESKTDSDQETDSEKKKKNLSPEPSTIQIGEITLEAELIPFENPLEVSDMENIESTVYGNTLYLLDKKNLRTFTITDSSVVHENDIKLQSKYEKVDADVFGNIYLSNRLFNVARLNDDSTVTELDLTGKLAMSKVLNFGLICNGKDSISTYSDDESEEWVFGNTDDSESSQFTKITDIEFVGNHILVGGNFNDGKDTLRAAVYDYEGNQLALTDNKISGSEINSMTETDNGIIVASASNISLWNSDGTEIGQTKSSETTELFGTDSPVWINDVFAMDDGSVLAVCSGERDDGKEELLLYKIWGF